MPSFLAAAMKLPPPIVAQPGIFVLVSADETLSNSAVTSGVPTGPPPPTGSHWNRLAAAELGSKLPTPVVTNPRLSRYISRTSPSYWLRNLRMIAETVLYIDLPYQSETVCSWHQRLGYRRRIPALIKLHGRQLEGN